VSRTAVIAGVGPGLGASLARRFVDEGCRVGLFARSSDYVDGLADELGDAAVAVQADVTNPEAVRDGFETVRDAFGAVDVFVHNASGGAWKGLTDISVDEFDHALEVCARGALLCSQEAVGDMLDGDGGTIVFTGATSAVRGRDRAVGFSAGKFAARGMAESMARELGPDGIHVAHVVIDGQIRPPDLAGRDIDRETDTYLDPDSIADEYWHLVEQDRSSWTLECDVRPHVEDF
jgi:NAD(P)-dependent dehydrogenase (short-subunit alcohol dehydrogenase family)